MDKMKLVAIAAVSVDGVIGIDDNIPWRIPEDFKHFRETTMGHVLLIGYTTYTTLPEKALEGREYIVMNGGVPFKHNDHRVYQFRYLDLVLELLGNGKNSFDTCFVAGGASIYEALIDHCDEAIITWVNKTYPEGNKKFPIEKLFSDFEVYSDQDWLNSKNGYLYKVTYYNRNGSERKKWEHW